MESSRSQWRVIFFFPFPTAGEAWDPEDTNLPEIGASRSLSGVERAQGRGSVPEIDDSTAPEIDQDAWGRVGGARKGPYFLFAQVLCVCLCVCVCARARACVCVWGGGV